MPVAVTRHNQPPTKIRPDCVANGFILMAGVSPGPVATDRLLKLFKQRAAAQFGDESRHTEFFKGMAFDRPATPEEIANTVAFVASERSSYTSGIYVTIDGGYAAA